jgi:hypothetical protein
MPGRLGATLNSGGLVDCRSEFVSAHACGGPWFFRARGRSWCPTLHAEKAFRGGSNGYSPLDGRPRLHDYFTISSGCSIFGQISTRGGRKQWFTYNRAARMEGPCDTVFGSEVCV